MGVIIDFLVVLILLTAWVGVVKWIVYKTNNKKNAKN